jgi:hypothetical protein
MGRPRDGGCELYLRGGGTSSEQGDPAWDAPGTVAASFCEAGEGQAETGGSAWDAPGASS